MINFKQLGPTACIALQQREPGLRCAPFLHMVRADMNVLLHSGVICRQACRQACRVAVATGVGGSQANAGARQGDGSVKYRDLTAKRLTKECVVQGMK